MTPMRMATSSPCSKVNGSASNLGTAITTAHGSATVQANGSFAYTPTAGYFGADSFTYVATDGATDGTGLSNTATVNLNVTTTLSVPTNIQGGVGTTIVVPVNIDNPDPTGRSGLVASDIAILYDPTVLGVDTVGAVSAGTVFPSAAKPTVTYAVDTSGNNGINAADAVLGLHVTSGAVTTTTSGSLFLITFHVLGTDSAGATTAINIVPSASIGAGATTTNVSDTSGAYPLHPVPTNSPTDPGVDGLITIVNANPILTPTSLPAVPGSSWITSLNAIEERAVRRSSASRRGTFSRAVAIDVPPSRESYPRPVRRR